MRARLGAGGFGTVYRAYDLNLEREVALKVLHEQEVLRVAYPRLTLGEYTAIRERFLREGPALARVHHPNIVTVYDAGEADGRAYLAMALVEGASLGERLEARGPLPLADVIEITDQVAGALAAVHNARLVHRDIKPDNIIVDAESGRAVLLDLDSVPPCVGHVFRAPAPRYPRFEAGTPQTTKTDDQHKVEPSLDLGIARMTDARTVTSPGDLIGSLPFMAPEQLEGDGPATVPTDVYQLGATVYTLLAGQPPFGTDLYRMMRATEAPNLAPLRPDLPVAVAGVVSEAMARDPGDRPAGPLAFATRLRAAAELPPTRLVDTPLPRPVTGSGAITAQAEQQPRRSGGRWLWLGWLAAVAVGALLVAAVIGGWLPSGGGDSSTPSEDQQAAAPSTVPAALGQASSTRSTQTPPVLGDRIQRLEERVTAVEARLSRPGSQTAAGRATPTPSPSPSTGR